MQFFFARQACLQQNNKISFVIRNPRRLCRTAGSPRSAGLVLHTSLARETWRGIRVSASRHKKTGSSRINLLPGVFYSLNLVHASAGLLLRLRLSEPLRSVAGPMLHHSFALATLRIAARSPQPTPATGQMIQVISQRFVRKLTAR